MFINMDEESKITLAATNTQGWPNMANSTFNPFQQSEHSLCDVFLRGEDEMPMEPIPAQRRVLAANSLYFKAMFESGFVESEPNRREIPIGGVETDILRFIVEFLYVGSCCLPSGTKHSRVMHLLTASNMLLVKELSHACTIYLEQCLDSDSAPELWLSAESCGMSDLAETFKSYVQSYFWSISRSQRVLELDHQDMAALLGLEEVNLGNAANEDTLVELLLRWLTHNPNALDSDLLPDLLPFSKICWSEVSQECKDKFRKTLAEISINSSSESFHAEKVLKYISESSSLNQSFNRIFFCSVCSVGEVEVGFQTYASSMEVADIDTRTGTFLRQWSRRFGELFCFLPLHGHLYASSISNCTGNKAIDKPIDVLCLSVANVMKAKVLRTRSWDVGSVWLNLIEKHHYKRAIDEERGMVYLCGYQSMFGYDCGTHVFKLDMENNVCSRQINLPFGRTHNRAIVVKGELFVLGGNDQSKKMPISTVLKYDGKNDKWQIVSPMHDPRTDGAYACVDGRIYASGGSISKVGSRNFEVYNPSLDMWTKLSPMSVPRVHHRLVAVGTYLFAMGGESYTQEGGWSALKTVERYSITEGCWEAAWEMTECRRGIKAFTL